MERLLGAGKRRAATAALAALAAVTIGCGPGEARAPNPTRPLDERRAIEVIFRAVRAEKESPKLGRDVTLTSNGKTIHIDVGVEGHEYGMAYITLDDAQKLGDAIPKPNKKDERLHLVRAGADGETRIVLLFQDNYLYDDLAGEAHEQTTITCESSLARDVQDFVTHARTQKYK